jgi:anti-sigma factor RsiW
MQCGTVKEWLGPYLDGEVPEHVQEAVEAHLAGCRECAGELDALRSIASAFTSPNTVSPPSNLWPSIERRLVGRPARRVIALWSARRLLATAAILLILVGLGALLFWGEGLVGRAEAAAVNFQPLLNGLKTDASAAFEQFLAEYGAQSVSVAEAERYGAGLSFAIPDTLPGGFRRVGVYTLRFGKQPGVAARYSRDGELLGFIFHPPILQQQFGTGEDRDCVVGKHRGHAIDVGEWTLLHLTDPTTCHCVLSKLDRQTELPAVIAEIVPNWQGTAQDDPGSFTGPGRGHP